MYGLQGWIEMRLVLQVASLVILLGATSGGLGLPSSLPWLLLVALAGTACD